MANITKQTPADLSVIWAASGDTLRPTTTKIGTGWEVEIPPRQWFNWLDNKQDAFIAHVNQHGMPMWDSSTEYQNATSYVLGSNGVIYRCIQTHTNKDPVTAGDAASFWVQAFDAFDTSYTKAESDNLYLAKTANLSDLTNAATARTNLSVYSKTEADGLFLDAASNLSDLANNATARTNLDVYSKAEAAQKNGDNTQTFSVATPTIGAHATNKTYVDGLVPNSTLIPKAVWSSSSSAITNSIGGNVTFGSYSKDTGANTVTWQFDISGLANLTTNTGIVSVASGTKVDYGNCTVVDSNTIQIVGTYDDNGVDAGGGDNITVTLWVKF